MSWLSDRYKEASAQLNMRDGGKTASTVRASRQSVPAQTVPKKGIDYSNPVSTAVGLAKRVSPKAVVSQWKDAQVSSIKGVPTAVKAVADPFVKLGKVGVEYNRAALAKGSNNTDAYNASRSRLDNNLEGAFILGGANRLVKNAVGSVSGRNQDELDRRLAESVAQNEITARNALKKTRTPIQMTNNINASNQGDLSQIDYNARMRGRSASNLAGVAASAETGLDVGSLGLGAVGKGVLKPTVSRLLSTGLQGGVGSIAGSFGQDPEFDIKNAGQVAKTFATGAGTGIVAGEGTRLLNNVASGGINKVRTPRPVDPNTPTYKDVSNIMRYKNERGGFVDDAVHAERLNSLRKFGIDPTRPESWTQIDAVLSAQGGYINPKAMVDDAKNLRTNTTGIKNYNPDGLPKQANQFVHDYAKMLESTGSGQGVSVVAGKRVSNNAPAYRELFAKLGRKPTTKDWYDYAYDQINNGTAPMGMSDEFGKVLEDAMNAEKNFQDPKALVPNGATPVKNLIPQATSKEEWDSIVRSRYPDQQKVDVVNNNGKLELQRKTIAPVSGKETITGTVQTDATPTIQTKPAKDFTDASNRYLGSLQASDTTARQIADTLPFKLTGQDAIDSIVARDNKAQTNNPKIEAVNQKIQSVYDNLYAQYKDAGFDMGYVDEYSPRIYKNPKTGEAINKDEFLYLTRTPGQTISRTAQNVNPESLLYKTPQELLAHYTKVFEKAKAGREYFDTLKNKGYIVESGTQPQGLVPVQAPGIPAPKPQEVDGTMYQGLYYAHPEIADKLNRIFGINKGNPLTAGTAKLSSMAQDIGLSGGLPGTAVNSFTFAQITKELAAGKVSAPLRALWNTRSARGAQEYFRTNADTVTEMQKNGIRITSEYGTKTLNGIGDQIRQAEGVKGKAGLVWDKVMSDPTFKRFMPSLQVETYKQIKGKYVAKLGEERASQIASDVVKNFYGLTDMSKQATRSQTANDLATTVLFAPKYRESMANFWINNAKAIDPRNMVKPEYGMNVRFNVGATLLFGAMQAANMYLNGTPTWDNPDGKKDKLIVPSDKIPFNKNGAITGGKDLGIPFLSSIATVPRAIATGVAGAVTGNAKEVGKATKSFVSFGARPLLDIADNENYFGSRIYDPNASTGEKLGANASYLFKAYQHPYVREGLNAASSKLPEGVKKFTGAKEQTPFQTASQALESPLRYYDPSYYQGGADKFQANEQVASQRATLKQVQQSQKKAQANFDKSFSRDELSLLKASEDDKTQLLESGGVTQEELDTIDKKALAKRKELGLKPGTIGQTIPKELDKADSKVKDFYNDRAYVHDTDYEGWQSKTPDTDSGKDMLRRVNQMLPEGVELPQTNKTAELYAEFVKTRANSKWTKTIENNEKKKLIRSIYGTTVSEDDKLFIKQSDSIIRSSLVNGEIDQETMNRLVQYDDMMARLGGSPEIGKALRREYGYGLAPSTIGSKSTGSGYVSPYTGSNSLASRKQLRNLLLKYS